jgi:hypothetical protein
VGRPTKRTPKVEADIVHALRAGNTRKAACHYAGIDLHTLGRWMHFATFATAIEKAETDAEVRFVAQIAKAAQDGTWQAAAWWLERRRPDDYSRRDRVDVTVRQQAQKLAAKMGIDAAELIAEAERIVSGG